MWWGPFGAYLSQKVMTLLLVLRKEVRIFFNFPRKLAWWT